MEKNDPVVAIVDDDEAVRRALRRLVSSLSFQPQTFGSGQAFLDSLPRSPPQCVLLDLHMPGLKGLEVLQRMQGHSQPVPAIIITGFDEIGMREKCLAAGALAYLVKPLERHIVETAIEEAIAISS